MNTERKRERNTGTWERETLQYRANTCTIHIIPHIVQRIDCGLVEGFWYFGRLIECFDQSSYSQLDALRS